MIAQIYDGDLLVDELHPDDPERICWAARYGWSDLCGGCDKCILMQIHYVNNEYDAGIRIEWLEEPREEKIENVELLPFSTSPRDPCNSLENHNHQINRSPHDVDDDRQDEED